MLPNKTSPLGLLPLFLILTLSLNGCARETPMPTPVDTAEGFIEAARSSGAELQPAGGQGPSILGLTPQIVRLGSEQLMIYHATETLDPQQVRAEFELVPGLHHLWVAEHLMVLYAGQDGGTVLFVESLLGEPLIGPPVAGDEPYPPAIPAAIRTIAAAFGAPPTEIEVLAYEMVEWRDACLDFGEPDETCAAVITPGWAIQLRLGTADIEAHTDLLGQSIRWRSP